MVLDRKYTGLVIGLDARIHVVAEPIPAPGPATPRKIIVRSPQFKGAEWQYAYAQTENDGGVAVRQLDSR